MIELNKFIKKCILNREITSIWDKYWYPYTVAKILRDNEFEIRWKHIFLTWIRLYKYDLIKYLYYVENNTKTIIKNNFFYTLTK